MLHTIEPDILFDVVFLDFWEPGYIPDRGGSHKIIPCLDCIVGFGVGASIGMKEITIGQAARWNFGKFFAPFGLPKMIVVDAYGLFAGVFKKTFQDTLLIPLHAVARGNQKEIINEGFH